KIGTTAAQKKLFFNLRRLKQRISASHEGSLRPEEIKTIANELNVEEQEVKEMESRMVGHDHSLNELVAQEESDGGSEWIDYLEEPAHNQEILLLEDQEKRHQRLLLTNAMEKLNERERHIIVERRLKEP